MNITDELKAEHRAIEDMLKVMESVCAKLETGVPVKPGHIELILEFLREFADHCHHGKEEEFLFPALLDAGLPMHGGPIAVMLSEHEVGRGCIKGMRDALTQYSNGNQTAGAAFAKSAREYINLLTDHIDKEDSVIFVMAEDCFSESQKKVMAEGFKKIESEKIGVSKHESLKKILDDLKSIYLAEAGKTV
jgi:hemerythrin-like domain-containing protein